MDNWQVAQNYIVAAAIAGTVGGYYYYTSNQRKPNRTGSANGLTARRSETDLRERGGRRTTRNQEDLKYTTTTARNDSNGAAKKRKSKAEPTKPKEEEKPQSVRDAKPTKESDMSTAAFAQQMLQARQGANLSSTKTKETRVKTVKPRILPASSSAVSVAGTETATDADDEEVAQDAGDVSDMLEAKAAGPSTLRITPSEKQTTQRAPRQAKQEAVETKKQRQNRKKIEERKAQREEDERDRKGLEEKQRRTAREARGEPAKNGVARPPTSNPWAERNANTAAAVQTAAPVAHAPLLDTFDAESTSSSNGGLGASTAATSTTEGEQAHVDGLSEEEQMAAAIQQSGDETGWTTVAAPKKTKKQPGNDDVTASTSKKSNKAAPATNGQVKTGGFAALDHPSNDPNSWEA